MCSVFPNSWDEWEYIRKIYSALTPSSATYDLQQTTISKFAAFSENNNKA